MAESQDTEITLGTGRMLVLFFGLVVLCALFFGLGFSLGRNSAPPATAAADQGVSPAGGARPAAVKPGNNPASAPSSPLTFYKAVGQKDANPQLTAADTAASGPGTAPPAQEPSATSAAPPSPLGAPPTSGYYVQVAAVSKPEDAEALVNALQKKQYSAFSSNSPADRLFHVQVGPFAEIKDAEATRARLISDGYNPILKK